MRLYYRKFIGLLILNFCSSAFSGPFNFYSFTVMPKWHLPLAGSTYIGAQCAFA